MEEDGNPPPFWAQPNTTATTTTLQRHRHRHRRSSSLLLSPGVLIVVLPINFLLHVFVVIPSLLSLASRIFRPNLVKKSWDSLNLLLVLFAIICGILGRRNDDESSNRDEDNGVAQVSQVVVEKPEPSTQLQWFDNSDRRIYSSIGASDSTNAGRLRRNSSSYPDLRLESSWVYNDDDRWRFFDDTEVNTYRPASENVRRRRGRQLEEEVSELKTIPVDRFVVRPTEISSSPPPPRPQPSQPPPPPPPPPVTKQAKRRTFRTVEREKTEDPDSVWQVKKTRPMPPPPPPPPPPYRSEQKSGKSDKKRGGGAKEIANTLASLYHQRKKKKKKQTQLSPPLHSGFGPPPSPPPPPPPPPPPASLFHNFFSHKKGSKSKRNPLISSPPPPPASSSSSTKRKTRVEATSAPPPPPPSDSSRQRKMVAGRRPPLPTKMNNFYDGNENLNSGGQSPLIPIPPPPPPPPFQIPDPKFTVRGDFVRIRSSNSSRSSSPDLDYVDVSPIEESTTTTASMEGGDASGAVFCPSPDVNTKADTFIARFRAGLKLEKLNSIREKQEMGTAAPGPDPSQV